MSVIEHPLATERAMNQMGFGNKLQFIVRIDSTKSDVKPGVESRYDVTVEEINARVTMKSKKKAIVRPSEGDGAQGIALRIGVF